MIGDLFRRLLGEEPQPDPDQDYRLSLAALLVRCAKVDDVYDDEEQARIDAILAARYGLDAASAAELRDRGEAIEAGAGDTVHLTKAIKEGKLHIILKK